MVKLRLGGKVFMPTNSFELLNKQKVIDQKRLEYLSRINKKEMTSEELKEHKHFLKSNLKKNYFN